jgi:hypothetical protein
MKTFRGWIPAGFLAVALLFGSTAANAGIIIGGASNTDSGDPCGDSTVDQLLNAATGIIIGGAGYTGIIVVDNSQTACGIIIGGAS